MPNPRYRPRQYALDAHDFGKDPSIRWRRAQDLSGTESEAQLAAAQLQHHIAWDVRERLRRAHVSVAEFASVTHTSAVRWRALLNGEVIMRLEDVALAQRALGIPSRFIGLD